MRRLAPALLLLALAGCEGALDPGPASPRASRVLVFEPGPAALPRLTAPQYRSTLEAIFGEGLPPTPVERDTNPYLFFTIGAASTTLSEVGAQQYAENAHAIATWVTDPARREAMVGCAPSEPGDACVQGYLAETGRALYRRPLDAPTLARWVSVSRELAEGDAWRGLRLALAGMLQSPAFLYRAELGSIESGSIESGSIESGSIQRRALDGFEIASRLSFLLWNTSPDATLLDAAESGELDDPDAVYAHAARMLDDPRARRASRQFFAQYLDLGRLEQLDRSPERFPLASPTLGASMRTEIELLVDDLVFRRDEDFRELFRTRRTFVNAELAMLYGVPAEGASPIAFVPVELPADGPRAGFLTLGAFLAMNAHPTETSPTLRGKYVRERILCELVPPPPADVDTTIDEVDPMAPRTLRERLEQHRSNPSCAACHASIDPPGFLFEGFDSIGAVQTLDHGFPVDTSGDFDGEPLRDGRDLGEILAREPRVTRCVVRQLWRHAIGRLEVDGEEPALDALHADFAGSGYRFRELLLDLATSEALRTVGAIPDAAPEVTP